MRVVGGTKKQWGSVEKLVPKGFLMESSQIKLGLIRKGGIFILIQKSGNLPPE
jgi:hypothetical protein